MTVNKRKKNSRQRGSHTHGWGAMKKHRGAGNRGGRGMAGTGKKADSKKPSIWNDVDYFGKKGFKMHGVVKKIKPINLNYFEEKAEKLLAEKLIAKEGENYIIDASKLDFNKILGSGRITKKFKITAEYFSKLAAEKLKKTGGEAIELKKAEKARPKEEIKAEPKQKKED